MTNMTPQEQERMRQELEELDAWDRQILLCYADYLLWKNGMRNPGIINFFRLIAGAGERVHNCGFWRLWLDIVTRPERIRQNRAAGLI